MTTPPSIAESPYVGPNAFRPEDRHKFFGRDQEIRDLLNLLIAERIVLLQAPSGAGKTSLIQAGLIPSLADQDFLVLPIVRVNETPQKLPDGTAAPNRYVRSALLSLAKDGGDGGPLPPADSAGLAFGDYLDQVDRQLGGANGEEPKLVVLIFDQFEEILTLDPTDLEAKAAFFTEVGAALRPRHRWALFSIREDYLAALDSYLRPMPTQLATTFRLDLLGVDAARQAIQQPARNAGVDFTDAAAARLVDDLRQVCIQQADGTMEERLGTAIEPVQLQVVCERIWKGLPPDATAIEPQAIEAQGDVDEALGAYYAEAVSEVAHATEVLERDIRTWFDDRLITPQGVRDQILLTPPRSGGLDDRAIWRLVDKHLVRKEERRGTTWFELAHDRLVGPVRRNNAAWFDANLSPLQRQAHLWDSQQRNDAYLFNADALAEAETWLAAYTGRLTEVECAFLEACRERAAEQAATARRLHRRLLVAMAFGVVAVVAAIWAFLMFQQAEVHRGAAEAEARVALSLRLADQSRAHSDDLDLGLLLAAEAYDLNPEDPQVRRSLWAATHLQPRLDRLLHGHKGEIRALAFDPDGTMLASGGDDGTIRFWDPVSGEEAAGSPGATGHSAVLDLAVRPGGQQLASASPDAIQLWDLPTGAPGAEIARGEGKGFEAVAFSPDGATLASSRDDGTIELWDPETGEPKSPAVPGHAGEVLIFSPDGKTLYSGGSNDGTIRFWDVAESGQLVELEELETAQGGVTAGTVSPDGLVLATAGSDGTIRFWDTASRKPIGEPVASHGTPTDLAFSPNGTILYAAGADGAIQRWEVTSRQPLGEPIATGRRAPISLAPSPDGLRLASGGADGTIHLWDATPERELFALRMGSTTVPFAIAYSPDGAKVATGHEGGEVLLWDAADGSQIGSPLRGHADRVSALAFSPDGAQLASASWDGMVQLWEMDTGETRSMPLLDHEGGVFAVAFNPGGDRLATGGQDGSVRLWRTSDGYLLHDDLREVIKLAVRSRDGSAEVEDFSLASAPVQSLTFASDGTRIAAADDDGAVRLWNLEAPEPVLEKKIPTGQGTVYAVCFLGNENDLVTAGEDGSIRFWNVANPSEVGPEVQAHVGAVRQMVCDPGGLRLATSGDDGRVRPWQVESGSATAQDDLLAAGAPGWQEGSWQALAFSLSQDGSRLAFTSNAGADRARLNLWDMEGDKCDRAFPIVPVLSDAEITPNGERIAAGWADGRVTLWEAETDTQLTDKPIPEAGGVERVAFSPDGTRLALGMGNGAVWLWDVMAASPVGAPFGPHEAAVSALAFSGDGMLLASGAHDGTVQIWDTVRQKPFVAPFDFYINSPAGTPEDIEALAFSPDRLLLAVSGGTAIGLWDIKQETWVDPLPSGHHNDIVAALAFRGSLFAAGQQTGTITVWDIADGSFTELGELNLTSEAILSLVFEDGRTLTVLDRAGIIWRLDFSEESWRQRACDVANRNLTEEEWKRYIGNPESPIRPYSVTCPELPLPTEATLATPVGESASGQQNAA